MSGDAKAVTLIIIVLFLFLTFIQLFFFFLIGLGYYLIIQYFFSFPSLTSICITIFPTIITYLLFMLFIRRYTELDEIFWASDFFSEAKNKLQGSIRFSITRHGPYIIGFLVLFFMLQLIFLDYSKTGTITGFAYTLFATIVAFYFGKKVKDK